MKNLLISLMCLVSFVSCSRGSGVYAGQVMDASWEGWFFKSCEVTWKTNEQSSTVETSSSTDKELCDKLQENLGKKYKVRYKHHIPFIKVSTPYIITEVTEFK